MNNTLISQHPDYAEETQYLSHTLQELEKTLKIMQKRASDLSVEVHDKNRRVTNDSSQDYIDLMVGSALLSYASNKTEALEAVRQAPYFARIDFREDKKQETERFYLGKTSIIEEEDQKLLVVDWRAPVANLYYEGRIGENHYRAPQGEITGELSRKRQYVISSGALTGISDVDIVTDDELLSACLEANATNRLKEIVGTIQGEQNQIIRSDLWKTLIVQGSAGAGKTTVALHRIAYLLYAYAGAIAGDNFMILGPNQFFLNYISAVLPDLSVGEVKQSTFEDFARAILGKKFKIQDIHHKLRVFLGSQSKPEEIRWLKQESYFKSSQAFIDVCEGYLRHLEWNYLPKEDLTLAGQPFMSYRQLQDLFLHSYRHLCFEKRIPEMKKNIQSKLRTQKAAMQRGLEEKCERLREKIITQYPNDGPQRREAMRALYDKRDALLRKLDAESKTLIERYAAKLPKTTGLEYYKQLYTDDELFDQFVRPAAGDFADYLRQYTLEHFRRQTLELEDLAPAMLLAVSVKGLSKNEGIRHVVIDEAQDLSLFQFYMLKRILHNCTFTILGDLYQRIHGYRSIQNWDEVQRIYLPGDKGDIKILQKSYRTTIEVVDKAGFIMERLHMNPSYKAIPFLRHGDEVVYEKLDYPSTIEAIGQSILRGRTERGYVTFAVICKNQEDAATVYRSLKERLPSVQLIAEDNAVYDGGISVLPSYLAKGMEFDAVYLPWADADHYQMDDLDGKLLYVSMTRALHSLYLYYEDEITPLLACQ